MNGWMYRLGRMTGRGWRKGRWMWASVAGDPEDALRAEQEMGRDLADSLLEEHTLTRNRRLREHVTGCGQYLVSRLVGNDRQFSFQVIESEQANAFAFPGGYIFMTAELLDRCTCDRDETSFVLAHEMGHVVKGHALDRMMTEMAVGTLGRAWPQGRLIRSKVLQIASAFASKAYSRHQEFEADLYGLRLLRSGGLDLLAAERLLNRLESATARDDENSPLVEYISTHPPTKDRIAELKTTIRQWQRNKAG